MIKKTVLLTSMALIYGCAVDSAVAEEPQIIMEETPSKTLEQKIGSMLMVGFMGTTAPKGSQICKDIYNYNLGGVILFDYNPVNHKEPKNIYSREQVANLTMELKSCSRDGKLLIAVDQEGGKVQRLKTKYGFYGKFPKAQSVRGMKSSQINQIYQDMAYELSSVGINYNLAPVVDLALNRKNRVIYKLGRSYGSRPDEVVRYSSIFINAMHQYGVLTSLKHFPGHGSSLGDTHKGFVDVTKLWQPKELEPYKKLNQIGLIDSVMVAHVFNRRLDPKYPATLSNRTVNGLLRQKLGFDGVVITDDLQMGAITHKYSLRTVLKLAINAGNDILLFGNQLSVTNMVSPKKLVDAIIGLIQSGEVSMGSIDRSNERIERLKSILFKIESSCSISESNICIN